jgi:hypothetical protein
VVSESHRPEENTALCGDQGRHRAIDLRVGEPAHRKELLPRCRLDVGLDLLPPLDVVLEVPPIDAPRVDDALEQRLEDRDVASDVGLEVEVGHLRAEQQRSGLRRDAEPHEPELPDGIDDDDGPAALADLDELDDEPRVVRRGIGPGDEREVVRSRSSSVMVAVPLPTMRFNATPDA